MNNLSDLKRAVPRAVEVSVDGILQKLANGCEFLTYFMREFKDFSDYTDPPLA